MVFELHMFENIVHGLHFANLGFQVFDHAGLFQASPKTSGTFTLPSGHIEDFFVDVRIRHFNGLIGRNLVENEVLFECFACR